MVTILGRIAQKAYDVFTGRKREMHPVEASYVPVETYYPTWTRPYYGGDASSLDAIKMRIANEVAGVRFKHCITDGLGGIKEELDTELNDRLNREANIDQTGADMFRELVVTMFESPRGDAAIVPTHWDEDDNTHKISIEAMRVGTISQYAPMHVRVRLYNEQTGLYEEIWLDKRDVVIVNNPLYEVINKPTSTARRLAAKLEVLDVIDDDTVHGRLNMIMQLPYKVSSPTLAKQADAKVANLNEQLKTSKYGIAWMDNVDKIIQLNRPLDNSLQSQVEYLTKTLYAQLGVSEDILSNTADEATMLNFYNASINPILSAIADNLNRRLIDRDARKRGEAIVYVRDPFKMVSTANLAVIADKFTRNEILSPNEVRGIVGFKPSTDPKANELRNRNINQSADAESAPMAD